MPKAHLFLSSGTLRRQRSSWSVIRDGECPVPQSFEFWHALKTLGVETQFVVYPNEGHSIAQPEHRRDIIKRTIAWYNQHLR